MTIGLNAEQLLKLLIILFLALILFISKMFLTKRPGPLYFAILLLIVFLIILWYWHSAHCNITNYQTIYESNICNDFKPRIIHFNKHKSIIPPSLPVIANSTAKLSQLVEYHEFDSVARPLINNTIRAFKSNNLSLNSITIQDVIDSNPSYNFSALRGIKNPYAFTVYTNSLIKHMVSEY